MSITPAEVAAKVCASMSVRMVMHLEFATAIRNPIKSRLIGVFQPYWRGEITLGQLVEAMDLTGYKGDLATDRLTEFVNKEDMH